MITVGHSQHANYGSKCCQGPGICLVKGLTFTYQILAKTTKNNLICTRRGSLQLKQYWKFSLSHLAVNTIIDKRFQCELCVLPAYLKPFSCQFTCLNSWSWFFRPVFHRIRASESGVFLHSVWVYVHAQVHVLILLGDCITAFPNVFAQVISILASLVHYLQLEFKPQSFLRFLTSL